MLNSKISLFLLACFVCIGSAHLNAQYFDEAKMDSSDMRKKNTIGLHLNVPLVFIMTASSDYMQLGVSYKRKIADNKKLVLQANWIPTRFEDNGILQMIGSNDSLLLYKSSQQSKNDFINGIGLEWANYDAKISPYYGLDLLFGIGTENISSQYYKARRDTSESYIVFSPSDTVYYNRTDVDFENSPIYGTTETNRYMLGAAFTFGCRVKLKSRFEIWAQMTPRLLYSHRQDNYENLITGRKESYDSNEFDFQLRLLQVLLAYTF
jgi:hypothetical protein